MAYRVKEIVYSLQGEGYHTGRPAVFCRFTGCNLWNGKEADRASAACRFCDADFTGTDGQNGGVFDTAEDLAEVIDSLFPDDLTCRAVPYVVFTGGEPALQLDEALVDAVHHKGFEAAVETNGTLPLPNGLDWVTVSPKSETALTVTYGNELKLVWPQACTHPTDFEHLGFEHFYLQPLDDTMLTEHITACVKISLERPCWKLSLQTQKILANC